MLTDTNLQRNKIIQIKIHYTTTHHGRGNGLDHASCIHSNRLQQLSHTLEEMTESDIEQHMLLLVCTCCCSIESLCDFSIWFIFSLILDSWY